jgi:resuscitation-promoting factor RpfB
MNKLWIPVVALVIPAGIAGATLINPEADTSEVVVVQAEPSATETLTPPTPTPTALPTPSPTPRPRVVLSPLHDDPELTAEWQRSLSDLGYSITVDGIFGPGTTATTKLFQIDNNLEPSGLVDEQMLEIALFLSPPEATPTPRPTPVPPTPTATPVRVFATPVPPQCHPSYEWECVPFASDVDCLGNKNNGPVWIVGPVRVVGPDVYRLDGNDNDGIGCE